MTMLHYAQTMADYNQWMNEKLMLATEELNDQDLRGDCQSFFGSLLGTWNHIMVGDLIWLRRFASMPALPIQDVLQSNFPQPEQLDDILFADWSKFKAKRRELDQLILQICRELSVDALDESLTYQSTQGEAYENPLWLLLTHFFNHQTHHRGQISDILYRHGVKPGVTDLVAMIREQKLAKKIG